jgi:hypothetical protein
MPRTSGWNVVRTGIAAAAVAIGVMAVAPRASAQEVHVLEPASDTVHGVSGAADAPRLLPIRLFEGAPFSVEVKADKGSLFHPSVALYGTDRKVDADAVFVVDAKGVKASLKNYLPKGTGLHWIEVRGADAGAGGWTMKTKIKLPKGVSGAGTLGAPDVPVEFQFPAPGRAVANITVTGFPAGSGAPTFEALRETGGPFVDQGALKPGKAGFSLKGAQLGKQGNHSLLVKPGPGGPGTFTVKITWKVGAAPKRLLDAASVVADPVLLGLSPSSGDVTQVLPMHLAVDFAQPGAVVEFSFGSSVITVPAGAITLVPGEAQFSLNLAGFGQGTYDVLLRNPDGGFDSLDDALAVSAVSPVPASVSPAWSYEGRVARLRISGSLIQGNATTLLRRGPATIPGSVIALGAWDVVVTNPGAPPASLAGAFQVLQVITLDSMTPPDNRDAPLVDAVILGGGFVAGAEAKLSRAVGGGTEEIPGTGVAVVSAAEIHARFDTTDATPALWDLVLSFPTGEVRTLASVFRTRITAAGGDAIQPFSASQAADGPPALACNDATGEYLAAWVEEDPSGIVLSWNLYAQLLDAAGSPVGKPVKVSDDGGTMEKRHATAGYDPAHDEYLVVWTEKATVTPTQVKGYTHPNGSGAVQLFQVMAQRLAPADLSKVNGNVLVTDYTGYNRNGVKPTWYIGDFNSYRPALAFDASAKVWEIAWMEEFDTSGLYFSDDYDVFQRSFDPAGPTLGALAMAAVTDAHEGDPALAYDPKNGTVLLAYNARASSKGGDLDLYLGSNGSYSMLQAGNGDELGDPRVAVDPDSGVAVLTWTRAPADGTRWIEAAAVGLGDLTTVVGSVQTLAKGGTDILARPVVNLDLKEIHILWTRQDGKGGSSVMRRNADATSGSDLALVGDEVEVSSGSGDEGVATAVYASQTGETTALWLATLTSTGNPTYQGDLLPNGVIRGVDFWFQRLR